MNYAVSQIVNNDQTQVERLLAEEVNYDTRKVTNRSEKKIPAVVVEEIEREGVTLERLESLGLPIYKYSTQITIHGVFPGLKGSGRVAGYKNLIVNQNQTLGVRYNGVDALKKEAIAQAVRLTGKQTGFQVDQNSRGFSVGIIEMAGSRQEVLQAAARLKTLAEKLPGVFVGGKSVNAFLHPMLGYVAILNIEVKAIRQASLYTFIGFITAGLIQTPEQMNRLLLAEREASRQIGEKYRLEAEQQRQANDQAVAALRASLTLPLAKAEPKTVPFVLAVPALNSSTGKAVIRVYKVFGTRGGKIVYYYEDVARQEDINPNVDTTRTGNKLWMTRSASMRERMAKDQVFRVDVPKPEAPAKTVDRWGGSGQVPRIEHATKFNDIEVRFAAVPPKADREFLKGEGFVWIGKEGVWKATYKAPRWTAVHRYFNLPEPQSEDLATAKARLRLLALKLKLKK